MRKIVTALFFGGLLVGAALGQTPAPVNPPAPTPTPVVVPPKVDPPAPVVEPVQISGSSNVPAYSYAHFDAVGTLTSSSWICFPDRTTGARVARAETFAGGKTYIVSGAPGTYFLALAAMTPTGMVSLQTEFTLLSSGPPVPTPGPVGPPVPVPTPTPDPAALASPFWAIAVYDASKPLPATYTDATIGPATSDLGGHWLKFDVHDPSAANTAWMKAAAKAGAPVLVFVRSDGSVHSTLSLPADAAGIVAAVKAARGQR